MCGLTDELCSVCVCNCDILCLPYEECEKVVVRLD